MFNFGFSELLIIAVIALIFIGPKELPEIAKVIGRMLNELKRATGDLTSTLMAPQEKLRSELNKIMENPTSPPPVFGHKGDPDPLIDPKSEQNADPEEKKDGSGSGFGAPT